MICTKSNEQPIQWSIVSSSGREQLVCSFISYSERSTALICNIEIISDFWQRGKLNWKTLDITNDFYLKLPQALIDLDAVKRLRDKLRDYRNKLINEHLELRDMHIDLGTKLERGEPQVKLIIGKSEELIYTVGKPAFQLMYKDFCSMEGVCSFIIDQSCIALCIESIESFLENI